MAVGLALVAACSDDSGTPADESDTGVPGDVAEDSGADTGADTGGGPDAGPDIGPDAQLDIEEDVQADVQQDVVSDVETDVAPDVSDTGFDAVDAADADVEIDAVEDADADDTDVADTDMDALEEVVAAFTLRGSTPVRPGTALTLDGTSSIGPEGQTLTWSWTVEEAGGSLQSYRSATPSHRFTQVGEATITLVFSAEDGRSDTEVQSVTVEPALPAGRGLVRGRVTRPDGSSIEGATVHVDGALVATTNLVGEWSVELDRGVPIVVEVGAAGYTTDFRAFQIREEVDAVNIHSRLVRQARPLLLSDAEAGGTVTGSLGSRVVFPENAIVNAEGDPVTGAVTVTMTPLDYRNPNEFQAFPGGPLATTSIGDFELLESFGVVEVELTQGGEEVFIADGSTVTLDIPVTEPTVAAGAIMPLWSLNEATGIWNQEGVGTVVSTDTGLVLRGEVAHFSWWNADRGLPPRLLNFAILYPDGSPYVGYADTFYDMDTSGQLVGLFGSYVQPGRTQVGIPSIVPGVLVVLTTDGYFGTVRIDGGVDEFVVDIELEDRIPDFTLSTAEPTLEFTVSEPGVSYVAVQPGATGFYRVQTRNQTFGDIFVNDIGDSGGAWATRVAGSGLRIMSGAWDEGDIWLVRIEATAAGTISMALDDATSTADSLNTEYPLIFSGATSRLTFFAPAGTWIRAVGTVPGFENTVGISVIDANGNTLSGPGQNFQVGDTGAVQMQTTGVHRIEYNAFFDDLEPREGTIRLYELPPPAVLDARFGSSVVLNDDGPWSEAQAGRLFLFGMAAGDAHAARVSRSNGASPTPLLALAILNRFGALGTYGVNATQFTPESDVISTRLSSSFETDSTGILFVAHLRGGSGNLTVDLDAAAPSDFHRIGSPESCDGATTRDLWAAAATLTAGGVIEVCPGEHVAIRSDIIPGDGALLGIGDERSTIRSWRDEGFTNNATEVIDVEIENLRFNPEAAESGIGFPFPQAGAAINIVNVELNGALPASAGFVTSDGIAATGGNTITLSVRDCNITGYTNGISFPSGAALTVADTSITNVTNGIASSGTRSVTVTNSDFETRNTSIQLNNSQNGNTVITDSTFIVAPTTTSQSAIFVSTGTNTTIPVQILRNTIVAQGEAMYGVVISNNADDAVQIVNNDIRIDGGTIIAGIDLRDSSSNPMGEHLIAGNLVLGARDAGIQIDGIEAMSALRVLNNTIQSGGTTSAARSLIALLTRASAPTGALPITVGNNLLIGSSNARDFGVGLQSTGFTYSSFENRVWNTLYITGNRTTPAAFTAGASDAFLLVDPALDLDSIPTVTEDIADEGNSVTGIPETDLRGTARPLGAGIDIGAIEFQ